MHIALKSCNIITETFGKTCSVVTETSTFAKGVTFFFANVKVDFRVKPCKWHKRLNKKLFWTTYLKLFGSYTQIPAEFLKSALLLFQWLQTKEKAWSFFEFRQGSEAVTQTPSKTSIVMMTFIRNIMNWRATYWIRPFYQALWSLLLQEPWKGLGINNSAQSTAD